MTLSPKYLPSFGRRKGRKLTPERRDLMGEYRHVFINLDSPHPNPLPEGEGIYGASLPPLPLREGRGEGSELWLEIGFGSGEHLAHQALQNPGINFIGCETFLDGCGALIRKIAAEKIANIRIWNDDARLLLAKLPNDSISKVFILFPDPWPKKRHNKRRLIGAETLDMLARVMKKRCAATACHRPSGLCRLDADSDFRQ